mgnify:CR=1 FL=1
MNDFILFNLNKLKLKKIPNPEIDLRILLNYSKYIEEEIILSNLNMSHINVKLFNILLNRRLENEPISKIINKKSFWKDDFYVNQFVLDPRPETEFIIEESSNIIKDKLPTKGATNWFNNILSMIVYCKVGIDGKKEDITSEHTKRTKILELKIMVKRT